jgi:hypothetical protein
MSTNRSPNASLPLVQNLISGTAKHFSTASSLAFGGATYTVASLTALLQSFVTLVNAVSVARAAYKAQLVAVRAQMPALLVVVHAYVQFIRATYGNSPDTLADFGLSPRKTAAPKTVAEKAAAVAQNLATRAARHTLGPKAKAAIKGTVSAPQGTSTGEAGSVTNGQAPAPVTAAPATTKPLS